MSEEKRDLDIHHWNIRGKLKQVASDVQSGFRDPRVKKAGQSVVRAGGQAFKQLSNPKTGKRLSEMSRRLDYVVGGDLGFGVPQPQRQQQPQHRHRHQHRRVRKVVTEYY